MGQIKWYKRDPQAALDGMMPLALDERGAYNTVLDLIYVRDGVLPDDDRFISGYLGVDPRVWKRIKQRLLDLGKLYVADGLIRNERADEEVDIALRRVASSQYAGKQSGVSRARKSKREDNKNNTLERTDVATDRERDPEPLRDRYREEPNGSSPRSPREKTKIEIPDWVPAEQWAAFLEMRKRKRAVPTPRAIKLLIETLDELRRAGHDPGAVLDQSTRKSWTDVYELKDQKNGRGGSGNRNHAPGHHGGRDNRDGFERAIDRSRAERLAAERSGTGDAGSHGELFAPGHTAL